MIKKVSGLNNNIIFYGIAPKIKEEEPCLPTKEIAPKKFKQVNELIYTTTPDFGVQVPQNYTKTSTKNLPNGLKVHSYKLSNGYRVSVVPMEDSPTVVKTYVNVGSLNETPDIKGISHFLEHMAFNGTNGEDGHLKLETGDSFRKIDEMGGWANASTNYALTDYINVTPLLEDKDLATQIKILAAMNEDLKLSDEMIEKEKGPVSSEINMILDDPKTIALDQTIRSLFGIQNPADELVAGSVNHIQNLTRKDVMDYYNKYYTPENTNIVVTGNVNPEEVIELVSKNFVSKKVSSGKRYEEKLTPIEKTVRKDFTSDKTKSTEIVLGFKGPENKNYKDKILYHVAATYLKSETTGLGRKLQKYHAGYGLGNERISTNPNGNQLIYIGATSSEKNSEKVLKTIISTINNIKPISTEELNRIKDSIKEDRALGFEYSTDVNDMIGNAVLNGDIDYTVKYNEILDEITPQEVDNAIKRFFDTNKTAITMVHPSKQEEISFKGKNRTPINEDKISKTTLDNNFDVGFYETNSPKQIVEIDLKTDIPYKGKAGVKDILDEIYTMGTENMTEEEFNKYLESLNINIYSCANSSGIHVDFDGNSKNYKEGLKVAKELLYKPRINEETLNKAKNRIKEHAKRSSITANSLYYNKFYTKYSDDAYSQKEIIEALDSITADDVKDFHNYVLNNSRGIVAANLPKEDSENIKNNILDAISQFKTVKENIPAERATYKKLKHPIVLTSAENNSQADIKQVYNFKYNDSIKNYITADLMNSILSNSSIGLFDNLREKEQLAYSVYSDISVYNNSGEISLNILTTTDNKENGEKSYKNIERSITGFHRQIQELINGNFTDKDLENAKRIYKARLLDNEGTFTKVAFIKAGMKSKYGIDLQNKMFNEIDSITKDDIISFARNAFSEKPVYAITATQDSLEANKEFLESLKN